MKLKLLAFALLLPCFISASVKLDVDLKMDDELIKKELTLQEGESASIDCDKYILETTVTPEDEQVLINMQVYKKTDDGNVLVCAPVVKGNWEQELTLECSACKDVGSDSRYPISIVATQV